MSSGVHGRAIRNYNGLKDETESSLGDLFPYADLDAVVEC
jgi:hypothetical protein